MEKRKIIAIVGPTASGKTDWGVSIAKKYQGEIISADSRQVYRQLDIGTGKDLNDYGNVKYHLIDICDPGESFTMFDWLKRARLIIDNLFSRDKTPIIVGGTGLYVQSLVEGFQLVTEKFKVQSSNVKKFKREELEGKTLKELQRICLRLKTDDLQLDFNNPHRVIRAIERAQSGEIVKKKKPDFEVLQIAVDLPREILYRRIDQRVENWFEEGFITEVQELLNFGVDPKWLEKIGLEYRILAEFLLKNQRTEGGINKIEFEEMKARMKFAIHAYARRQLTWFRRFPEIVWCKNLQSARKEIKKFLK